MRHLWSLILALVLTPLIYSAAGVSAVRLADAGGFGVSAVIGLAAALVAGGLYAVLVMVRLSPVGPVVAGATYLGVTIWALVSRSGFENFLPPDLFTEKGALHRPVGMGTALLAGPLLLTVFSARRWRGSDESGIAVFDAAPTYSTSVASAAPSYSESVTSAAPSYSPSSGPPSVSAAPTYEPPVYTPPSSSATIVAPTQGPASR
ncbi:MAG TPA: hypothetical protein VH561_19270 [Micromonosporaceae bacterium]|jgi:hypothetical protein